MSEPLAERMRPQSLDDYVGQDHLVGRDGVLRRMIESGHVSSFILWGPPGVGKTTLAHIIASTLKVPFYTLSAVTSGVKDVRDVIAKAKQGRFFQEQSPILFIDEIHRFSKSQQDSLLGAVEQGVVTLIGATTENPSFEVIRPLLSRCQLYVLKSLGKDDLLKILHRALTKDAVLSQRHIELKETGALLRYSGGDARKLLNILDLVVGANDTSDIVITDALVEDRLQTNPLAYDKEGEMHSLLDGKDDRGRRRPAVHRPSPGHLGRRGYWSCQSQCAAVGQCGLRRRDEDRLARGAYSSCRGYCLFGDEP